MIVPEKTAEKTAEGGMERLDAKIVETQREVSDYLTKSKLPASDYVINPYVGCPHACKYCYARFMKRFTGHTEEWGKFIDVKHCGKPIRLKKLMGKSVFLSSVTDCYNPFEEKYEITRGILEQLLPAECEITISTKSNLILRDMDLLSQCSNVKAAMSVNTLDEDFKNDMDQASSISDRLDALEQIHRKGIHTVLFMSPMFPGITDFKRIIERSSGFIDEYWFENLNLRGSYKQEIFTYIKTHEPGLIPLYREIYDKGCMDYWERTAEEIDQYCRERNLVYKNYFYHEKLVKEQEKRK